MYSWLRSVIWSPASDQSSPSTKVVSLDWKRLRVWQLDQGAKSLSSVRYRHAIVHT